MPSSLVLPRHWPLNHTVRRPCDGVGFCQSCVSGDGIVRSHDSTSNDIAINVDHVVVLDGKHAGVARPVTRPAFQINNIKRTGKAIESSGSVRGAKGTKPEERKK